MRDCSSMHLVLTFTASILRPEPRCIGGKWIVLDKYLRVFYHQLSHIDGRGVGSAPRSATITSLIFVHFDAERIWHLSSTFAARARSLRQLLLASHLEARKKGRRVLLRMIPAALLLYLDGNGRDALTTAPFTSSSPSDLKRCLGMKLMREDVGHE